MTLFNVFSKEKSSQIKNEIQLNDTYLLKKLSSGEFNLVLDQARYPLNSLSTIFKDYDLNPEYQRKKVWDISRKSKLIESLIINIPIPPIFLYEVALNEFEVMDGLQRISTIIGFLNNEFELVDLEIWSELNGKKFDDLLPDFQNSIKRRYLSASIILKETNADKNKQDKLKQLVFERLNTGGIKLSPQEIRNATSVGNLNNMVNLLGDNNFEFKVMINYPRGIPNEDSVDRMFDRELVLRFFAYKDALANNVRRGTKDILDSYARLSIDKTENEAEQLRLYFEKIIDMVYGLFGEQGFSRNNKFEKMIYDTVMLTISNIVDKNIELNMDYDNLDHNNSVKNSFFAEHDKSFNGKYTSMGKVNERVELFYNFLTGRNL